MDDLDWLGIELMLAADDPPAPEVYEPTDGVVIIEGEWTEPDAADIAVWRPVEDVPRDGR